jgi:hypothetical protein
LQALLFAFLPWAFGAEEKKKAKLLALGFIDIYPLRARAFEKGQHFLLRLFTPLQVK